MDAAPSPTLPVSSLQEDKFWATPGEPSRILRFTDNLLDEEVNLEDMSSASFSSPLAGSSVFKPLKLFGDISVTDDEISPQTMPLSPPAIEEDLTPRNIQHENKSFETNHVEIAASPDPPVDPQSLPPCPGPENEKNSNTVTAGSTTRQHKIKVDEEVERIVVSLDALLGRGCSVSFSFNSQKSGRQLEKFYSLRITHQHRQQPLPPSRRHCQYSASL